MNISVINVKWGGEFEYIGRKYGGFNGSVLGNRFVIGKDGSRDDVIRKYRQWLWEVIKSGDGVEFMEFVRLCGVAKSGLDLKLGCWCKEHGREVHCHGDVLKSAIEWYVACRLRVD